MFFSVKDLEVRTREFSEEFPAGTIDFGPDAVQSGLLKASGRAELIEENHGHKQVVQDIRLVGELSGRLETKCARCLETVNIPVASSFDLLYRPLRTVTAGDEISISEAESEIGYYQGEGVLLEDVLKEQVLLLLPLKPLCNEDCKGLCPQCGKNLNNGNCDCTPERSDPRWAALADLKDRLKQ
jgi:uncharacterized protein